MRDTISVRRMGIKQVLASAAAGISVMARSGMNAFHGSL